MTPIEDLIQENARLKQWNLQLQAAAAGNHYTAARIFDLETQIKQLEEIKAQVDDVLVINWCGPRVDNDYCKALHDLITWNIQVHDDPQVSEVAKKRQDEKAALEQKLEWALRFIQGGSCYCLPPHTKCIRCKFLQKIEEYAG